MKLKHNLAVLLVAAALVFTAGCAKKRVWTVPVIHVPVQPAKLPAATEAEPPDLRPELAANLSSLMAWPRLEPVRPAVPRPPVRTEPAPEPEPAAPRPAAPQISHRLSATELANYQRQTGDAISTAERNLAQADGKTLSELQRDLAEKIRSFIGQSREAMRVSDWPRAHNLAQKAQLLSVELVNSMS